MSDVATCWRIRVEIAVPCLGDPSAMDQATAQLLESTIRGTRAEILKHVPQIGTFFAEKRVFGVLFMPESSWPK
jgi:hypothetical protein